MPISVEQITAVTTEVMEKTISHALMNTENKCPIAYDRERRLPAEQADHCLHQKLLANVQIKRRRVN